jgi:hypothetical protein
VSAARVAQGIGADQQRQPGDVGSILDEMLAQNRAVLARRHDENLVISDASPRDEDVVIVVVIVGVIVQANPT